MYELTLHTTYSLKIFPKLCTDGYLECTVGQVLYLETNQTNHTNNDTTCLNVAVLVHGSVIAGD